MRSAICCLLVFHAAPFLPAEPFADHVPARIETYLEERFEDQLGSMVIGTVDETGHQVFGAGRITGEGSPLPDENTVYEIGSITKTFTSLLALELERSGDLNLSDPISKHLPERTATPSFAGKEITLGNLASQDSGLPFNPDNFDRRDFPDSYNRYTDKLLYDFLGKYELTNAPGSGFRYSNTGTALLGHIMERITGRTFGDLVATRIADPLGMTDTHTELTETMRSRMATGHDLDGKPHSNLKLQVFAGAGALKSTANDMLTYAAAQLGLHQTKLLPLMRRSHVQLHSGDPRFGDTCMPWVNGKVHQPRGSRLIGHAGGTAGFSSFVGLDLKRRRGVVILSATRKVFASPIGWTLLQDFPLTENNLRFMVREITAIGVALATDDRSGLLKITHVFPRSSAGAAGLKRNQLIRSVDGESVRGRSMAECLKLMRKEPGMPIRLVVLNSEDDTERKFQVARTKFLTAD